MNAYERLFGRMAGKKVDRIPNMAIVMQFAGRHVGVPYGKMVSDYRVLADCMQRCQEDFHLDCFWTISDPMREAEGFGSKVVVPEDGVPYAPEPLIKDVSQIPQIRAIDPSMGRRMSDRVEGVRLLASRARGEMPVIGWVEGMFAEVCDLMGVSEAMMNLYDEPEAMNELMEVCLDQGLRFARAQVDAGASMMGVGDAATSLIGPKLYEEFALPFQKRLISGIKAMGVPVKLHICGDIGPVLPLVMQTGANMIDLDHMVDMGKAAQMAASVGACVCGNFDPVSVLLQGTPEDVRAATLECIQLGGATGIIAAGCEVPRNTPEENLLMVYETLAALG